MVSLTAVVRAQVTSLIPTFSYQPTETRVERGPAYLPFRRPRLINANDPPQRRLVVLPLMKQGGRERKERGEIDREVRRGAPPRRGIC